MAMGLEIPSYIAKSSQPSDFLMLILSGSKFKDAL